MNKEDYSLWEKEYEERISSGKSWGFELYTPEGECEYSGIDYNPDTHKLSCFDTSIEVDPDFDVDANLEALYDELMQKGYSDTDPNKE